MAVGENRHAEEIELEGDEDDSLLNGEATLHKRPSPRGSRLSRYCTFSVWWWSTNVIFMIVILYLAFELDRRKTLLSRYELAGDITKIGPRLPHIGKIFHPEPKYAQDITSTSFKEKTSNLWLELMPKGLGYVEVTNPSRYRQLPDSLVKDNKTVYRQAINGQLECLYDIMNSVNDLILDNGKLGPPKGEVPTDVHLSYCFDYLRQSLMCHGDTALEGAQTAFESSVDGTDGWNVRHICKPWDRIYTWLDRRKIDDSVW